MSVSAPAAYKQPSRKGKKAWRKNVDITAIDAGLEDLRSELISGEVISEKSDTQLFSLDLAGSKSHLPKEIKKAKPLKVDEILSARSAIPAISSRKRPPTESATTDGVLPPLKKNRKDWVSHKDVQKLKKIAYGGTDASVAKTTATDLHDPWAEPESTEKDAISTKFSFLELEKVLWKEIKPPKTLKMDPVSLSATGKKFPAVKLPQGGISYNPHFEEWDELLRKEGEKEIEAEKKRLQEESEERARLARLAAEEEEEESKPNSKEEEGSDDGHGDIKAESYTKPRPTRKTRVQRNKEKRHKHLLALRARAQHQKHQQDSLKNLRSIKRTIEASEMARLDRLSNSTDHPEKSEKIRRKKLGKAHLPPPPLTLHLPSELTESLRTLRPEGNLLKDRYRSLMERGILETRVMPVVARKKRVREVEKWSYKDFK